MFKLKENYEVDRKILKCDYIRYSPAKTSTINTPNGQVYIKKPREDSVISLLNSYMELNFEVIEKDDNSRYGNGNDIRLVNLGTIALFSNFTLTTSCAKHSKEVGHDHIFSLMYKLISSAKSADDLYTGFDRSRHRRKQELTNNENVKVKYHLRIMLRDFFGYSEHQQKATYGLGYKLTLKKIKLMLL